jgi:hypothetical protein
MSNIFKIIDEDHLLEILNKYQMKLTTVSFTTKQNDSDRAMKNCLIKLAKEYRSHMFIYIDLDNYKTRNIIKDINMGDTVIYFCYPRYEYAAKIVNRDVEAVVDIFKDTETRIRMKIIQLQQQQNKPIAKPVAPQPQTQQPAQAPMQQQIPQVQVPQLAHPVPVQQPIYNAPMQPVNQQVLIQQPIQYVQPQNVCPPPKPDISNLLNQIDVVRKKKESKK